MVAMVPISSRSRGGRGGAGVPHTMIQCPRGATQRQRHAATAAAAAPPVEGSAFAPAGSPRDQRRMSRFRHGAVTRRHGSRGYRGPHAASPTDRRAPGHASTGSSRAPVGNCAALGRAAGHESRRGDQLPRGGRDREGGLGRRSRPARRRRGDTGGLSAHAATAGREGLRLGRSPHRATRPDARRALRRDRPGGLSSEGEVGRRRAAAAACYQLGLRRAQGEDRDREGYFGDAFSR